MSDSPVISIIIPVYNVISYLKDCLDSVCNQTFEDFEVILIDDGSTDGSEYICDEYAAIDKRFRVIHKKNCGVAAARNSGLDVCTGNYICFLDSDDFLDVDFLAFMYSKIENTEYDFVSCCANFVNEHNCYIHRNEYKIETAEFEGDLFNPYMETNYIEDAPWNKIYKRAVFEGVRFVEGIIFEDSEIIIRILKKCKKVLFVRAYKYNYRIRGGSILNYQNGNLSKKGFNIKKLDLLKVYELNANELKDTSWELSYYRSIIYTCAKYNVQIHSVFNENKDIVNSKQIVKAYFKKYEKYLYRKKLFTWKEIIIVYMQMYASPLYERIFERYNLYKA